MLELLMSNSSLAHLQIVTTWKITGSTESNIMLQKIWIIRYCIFDKITRLYTFTIKHVYIESNATSNILKKQKMEFNIRKRYTHGSHKKYIFNFLLNLILFSMQNFWKNQNSLLFPEIYSHKIKHKEHLLQIL